MSAKPFVRIAQTDAEILQCFPVLAELRPHLSRKEFLQQVRRQMREGGYRIAFLEQGGAVKCVAGYRTSENLAWGKFLYVDDLVTAQKDRSRGHGEHVFEWLLQQARRAGCDKFHLDSGL